MNSIETQYKDDARGRSRHAVIMLGLFFLLLIAFGLEFVARLGSYSRWQISLAF